MAAGLLNIERRILCERGKCLCVQKFVALSSEGGGGVNFAKAFSVIIQTCITMVGTMIWRHIPNYTRGITLENSLVLADCATRWFRSIIWRNTDDTRRITLENGLMIINCARKACQSHNLKINSRLHKRIHTGEWLCACRLQLMQQKISFIKQMSQEESYWRTRLCLQTVQQDIPMHRITKEYSWWRVTFCLQIVQKDVSVLSLEENLMTQDESHWRKALFVQTVQKDIPFTKFEDTFQITLKDSHCVA